MRPATIYRLPCCTTQVAAHRGVAAVRCAVLVVAVAVTWLLVTYCRERTVASEVYVAADLQAPLARLAGLDSWPMDAAELYCLPRRDRGDAARMPLRRSHWSPDATCTSWRAHPAAHKRILASALLVRRLADPLPRSLVIPSSAVRQYTSLQ